MHLRIYIYSCKYLQRSIDIFKKNKYTCVCIYLFASMYVFMCLFIYLRICIHMFIYTCSQFRQCKYT